MKISIAGVDEVGRGSLIGPVYAAAVIFKNNFDKKKIRDSKKLTKKNREILEKYIKKNSYWSIGSASLKEIEKLNILNASLLAMKRAIKKLNKRPSCVLIDGNKISYYYLSMFHHYADTISYHLWDSTILYTLTLFHQNTQSK